MAMQIFKLQPESERNIGLTNFSNQKTLRLLWNRWIPNQSGKTLNQPAKPLDYGMKKSNGFGLICGMWIIRSAKRIKFGTTRLIHH